MLHIRDKNRILYKNLGFKSLKNTAAWLQIHINLCQSGFVMNFHLLQRHIWRNITQTDAMKTMTEVYKLKLTTVSEAVAINSFEVNITRFLNKTGGSYKNVKLDDFLSKISSFEIWDNYIAGYKELWKENLKNLERNNQRQSMIPFRCHRHNIP